MKKQDMFLGQPVVNTVANQQVVGVVAGFHATTGDPILRDIYEHGCRWVADAEKCEALTTADLRYKDGIVTFG